MPGAHAEPTLVEVAAGVHAYLQRGSWGFSNAGLIASGTSTLLVDTLFDLTLTERMLAQMRRAVPAARRIGTVVNTHANGDHCWGNQLVSDAAIIASRATAHEMQELKPGAMRALVGAARALAKLPAPLRQVIARFGRVLPRLEALAEAGEFVEHCFGAFDFGGIRLTLPTQTFEGRLTLDVGGKAVELLEVGPAHTKGDTVAWLPEERVAFTGDILFIGSHPIVWEGPISNWIRACDRLLELDPQVIVPGHGPLTTAQGVRDTKAYWEGILDAARRGRAAGASVDEVTREVLASDSGWAEAHRVVVNVDTAYRELSGEHTPRDPVQLFARMARLERR